MRIAIIGQQAFGKSVFEAFLARGDEVAGVFCAPEKPGARPDPLRSGSARVSLGDMVKEVHGGTTVFIPANTWIAVTNIGTDAMSLVFAFSAPGFEDFMRAESVPEGQKVTSLSKAEDAEIMKEHAHAVIYAEP